MTRAYYVYILSNQARCYYVGITNNMYRRWLQHRTGEGSAFCRAHHLTRLVYVETCGTANDAIAREKQLKKWHRHRKLRLIESMNPGGQDLAVLWGWRDAPESSAVVFGER
ncbi:MAG: GIY-YIG nuclease family protein [Gemmatimonadota bacterium]